MGHPDGYRTPSHEKAFQAVKVALVSAPVLAFPDFDRPFIIISDSSKRQVGGALVQLDDAGNERIIAYTSIRSSLRRREDTVLHQSKAVGRPALFEALAILYLGQAHCGDHRP